MTMNVLSSLSVPAAANAPRNDNRQQSQNDGPDFADMMQSVPEPVRAADRPRHDLTEREQARDPESVDGTDANREVRRPDNAEQKRVKRETDDGERSDARIVRESRDTAESGRTRQQRLERKSKDGDGKIEADEHGSKTAASDGSSADDLAGAAPALAAVVAAMAAVPTDAPVPVKTEGKRGDDKSGVKLDLPRGVRTSETPVAGDKRPEGSSEPEKAGSADLKSEVKVTEGKPSNDAPRARTSDESPATRQTRDALALLADIVKAAERQVPEAKPRTAETAETKGDLPKVETVRLPTAVKAEKPAEGESKVEARAPSAPLPTMTDGKGGKDSDPRRDERGRGERTLAAASVDIPTASASGFATHGGNRDATSLVVAPTSQSSAVSAALGQQIVDMGSSGQWLDSIAHQIASISASNGQGSFHMRPEGLGPIRVDITQGAQGAHVRMLVESETTQMSLMQDSGKLIREAQLSSVRIADVQVDRVAHVGEAQRTDTGQNPQQQNPSSGGNGSSAQAAMGQNAGQQQRGGGLGMAGQDAGGGSGRNAPKAANETAVSRDTGRDASAGTTGTGGRGARYA